jgi:hypothetical protein
MLQQIINFINGMSMAEIIAATTSFYTIANVIARITPTPKDDQIVNGIWKVFNLLLLKSKVK